MSASVRAMMRVQEAYTITAAVEAARHLGLFRVLTRRPSTAGELAAACRIDPRGTDALLRLLAHVGLVEEGDGRYRCRRALDGAGVGLWKGLEARLRDGVLPVACDTPAGASLIYPDGAWPLAAMAGEPAATVAGLLAEPGMRVLDVGAGAAPWSLAMHRHDASIHVTALDLPEVLVTTRRAVALAGAEGAFSYIEGDLFEVDLPRTAFDVAVAGMVCHLFGADRNRELMRRAGEALRPGGVIAIVDLVPDPVGRMPPADVIAGYDLSLFLRTSEGRAHPFSSLVAWLHETGFETVERIPIPGAVPLTMVKARKAR